MGQKICQQILKKDKDLIFKNRMGQKICQQILKKDKDLRFQKSYEAKNLLANLEKRQGFKSSEKQNRVKKLLVNLEKKTRN